MTRHAPGLFTSVLGVVVVTFFAFRMLPGNRTTVGFAYLLLVLAISSVWGFLEATLASIAATVTFNVFFLPPIGKFTIAEPQNGVALFSFLATALVARRISPEAKRWVLDTVTRERSWEKMTIFNPARYTSPKHKAPEVLKLSVVAFYERETADLYSGPPEPSTTRRAVALLNERFPDPKSVLFLAGDSLMRGDFDAFALLVAEDFRLCIRGFPPMDGTWRGRDAAVAAMRRNFALVRARQRTIDRVIDRGTSFVLDLRESGIFTSDGRTYNIRSVQTFTFANGKIETMEQISVVSLPG